MGVNRASGRISSRLSLLEAGGVHLRKLSDQVGVVLEYSLGGQLPDTFWATWFGI